MMDKRKLRGADHHAWKTGGLTYSGAHMRVREVKGRAAENTCAVCLYPAFHWSYDHADPDEIVGVRGGREVRYSADPAHYMPMCASCHKVTDLRALGAN